MKNAGKYNKRIRIVKPMIEDDAGFINIKDPKRFVPILNTWAEVKTTKGYTLFASHTDFEAALTRFMIRVPRVQITRDMLILYRDRIYSIEYINNVDEDDCELELQAKAVTK